MSAPIVQSDYEAMDTIARRFQQQNQRALAMKQRVDRGVTALRNGGWLGQGSAAFFQEMEREVNPAVQRLIDALGEAQQVTLQVKTLIREAEEEAASVFKSDGEHIQRTNEGTASGTGEADGLPNLMISVVQGIRDAAADLGKFIPAAATAMMILGMRLGASYPGQVIFRMPKLLEKLKITGRWLRTQAGLSTHLNHIKGANLARHIAKGAHRLPAIGWVLAGVSGGASVLETWSKRRDEYATMDGPRAAAARIVDAGTTLIPTVSGIAAGMAGVAGGAYAGAALGALGGPLAPLTVPAGALIGAVGGGIFGGWVGEKGGQLVTGQIESSGGREVAIDFVTERLTQPVADSVSAMASEISRWQLPDRLQPAFGFSL